MATDATLTKDQCVWHRLPDASHPFEARPVRFQVGCDETMVVSGVHPIYPDVCSFCDLPVRIAP